MKLNLPLIPTPPATCNAPVAVDDETVVFVTAKPETETIPVDGLTTKDVIVDTLYNEITKKTGVEISGPTDVEAEVGNEKEFMNKLEETINRIKNLLL